MLRIHFIQHWFNLADMACEEALYDSASLRHFVGVDLGREPVPDSTTITKFRKLLNDNKLGEALFANSAVQSVDGARQIDGGRGMSASTNRATALQRVQKAPAGSKSDGVSGRLRVKSHHLKINDPLLDFVASYSDHP